MSASSSIDFLQLWFCSYFGCCFF